MCGVIIRRVVKESRYSIRKEKMAFLIAENTTTV